MRALPYVGVVLLWLVTVAGVAFVVDQSFAFDDALIESTRTPIPGQRAMHLDARKYNLFFEARDISNPDRVGDNLSHLESSPLRIRIRAAGSDRLLQLHEYTSSFTMSGGRDSTAFATVTVPDGGRYEVTVSSSDDIPYSDPTIAFGEPIGNRVVRVVGGVILAGLGFVGGLILLVVTLVLRSRRTT